MTRRLLVQRQFSNGIFVAVLPKFLYSYFLSFHITSFLTPIYIRFGIVDRYIQHDVNAVIVVDETAEQLAVMVVNICRIIDPVLFY